METQLPFKRLMLADITKVSLIRVSATTHHYNTDQRLIWLQIAGKTSSTVTVKAPINNKLAPPGYYLVHVLNSAGVPSVGKFIKIPGSADLPPSDTTAPTVAITSPAGGATISGPSTGVAVNIAGTASDNSGGSGIQKVEVQVGSANSFKLATPTGPGGSQDWSTWSASDTVTTEGSHTITARATDNAGNTKDATVTVTVAFTAPSDTTAPTVAITSPAGGATISGPSTGVAVNIAGTASDNSGGSGIQKVEVQVGSANSFKLGNPKAPNDWSTWSASDTVTTEGSHTITARATDNAGNTKDATVTVTVAFTGGTYTSIYSVSGASGSYGNLNTGGLMRAGEWMHRSATYNSALIGQSVKRVNVILRRAGNATGTVSVVVRRFSDDSIVHTFGTIDAASISTTSDQTFTLEASSSYTIAANDRILVEWGGTGSST